MPLVDADFLFLFLVWRVPGPGTVGPSRYYRTRNRVTNRFLPSGEVTRPMCTAAEATAPSNTGQALAMVRAGLGYLAGCDAGSLGTAAQAEALIGLEHAEAQHTAARARILSVFTAQQGYEADGYYGPGSWLRAITVLAAPAPRSPRAPLPGRPGGRGGWPRIPSSPPR